MIAAVMGWSWHSDRSQVRPDGDVLDDPATPSNVTRARCVLVASETVRERFATAQMASEVVGRPMTWPHGRAAAYASSVTHGNPSSNASQVNP